MEEAAKSVHEDVKESISLAAEVLAGEDSSNSNTKGDSKKGSSNEAPNPFNIGKG